MEVDCWRKMRKFDLSLRSSRSSYFATFRHQLTILSKTDALDEEKWLNMLGTFVKDWFRYESHFVHGVFMPPNLGGFFMVRSYYPSECHADYFDFERIEALKPAIEACGISTLSQSPMLGFHKQMDNRIKLLEEILSFRMQGVEFDNGDMYVDGHKAASDVR